MSCRRAAPPRGSDGGPGEGSSEKRIVFWINRIREWVKEGGPGYAPEKTARWRRNEKRPPTDLAVLDEWTLKCPQNAITFSFWYQLHDPPQIAELREFMELVDGLPVVSFLDIGCHFGLLTFAAIHSARARAEATAVDASALALEMVGRIARLNGLEGQVRCIHSAVGAAAGDLEMVPGGRSAAGYFLAGRAQESNKPTVKMPVTTLDDLARQMPHPPTLIKIDVEGYEAEVIAGGKRTLTEGSIPLCLELHNAMLADRGVAPEKVLTGLVEAGYAHFSSGGQPIDQRSILDAKLIRLVARKEKRI